MDWGYLLEEVRLCRGWNRAGAEWAGGQNRGFTGMGMDQGRFIGGSSTQQILPPPPGPDPPS